MGRAKLPPELKPVTQSVRLSPETADLVCRMALRRNISVYAFLGSLIEKVFEKQRMHNPAPACYRADLQSSTLSSVLGESPSRRADRIAEPLPPR